MSRKITGATLVAGVAGAPVRHSLSPIIHNAWIEAAGLDAVYAPFTPPADGFRRFADGLRGGAVRGLNVTVPFKEDALAVADELSERAAAAGAVNLLVFEADGRIRGDNTDGLGLLGAFAAQAPGFEPTAGPVVIIGAGGAARGAAAAFIAAGAPQVRIVNRTVAKADAIAEALGGKIRAYSLAAAAEAFAGVSAVINATSAGLLDASLDLPLEATPARAVVMDMTYKPLVTPLLARAKELDRRHVDGLEMLIRQAEPSFEAFFGLPVPAAVDVRALCLAAIGGQA